MAECYECGEKGAKHSDHELPGDKRCDECHTAYLEGLIDDLLEELGEHVEATNQTSYVLRAFDVGSKHG